MEKEFNRNNGSYRPRRDDSREDYQSGRSERPARGARPGYGNRFEGRRPERYAGRETGEQRERNYSEGGRTNRVYGVRNREEGAPAGARPRRPRIAQNGQVAYRKAYTPDGEPEQRREYKPREESERRGGAYAPRKDYKPRGAYQPRDRREISEEEREVLRKKHYSKKKVLAHRLKNEDMNAELRLNRYIAMGGICSRRDADELIVSGRVKVNGEVVQTVGQKVKRSDAVEVDGALIVPERKVYLVLNKPKDYVTTVDDPLERKTVMSLIEGACKERIYPVGRLDRQTTGVLLFTNDGDLAKKLTHPKYDHKKIYHVFLDKPLEEADMQAIAAGIELEDGFIKADEIEYTSPDNRQVGIEIHSGKNRIVRRIFEHFGYQIQKLDRVYFAGITKKKVSRGKWRFLSAKEVSMLKAY